jgi:hypothetical protein
MNERVNFLHVSQPGGRWVAKVIEVLGPVVSNLGDMRERAKSAIVSSEATIEAVAANGPIPVLFRSPSASMVRVVP